jgi:uncharacterized damage-inducible protein DinB
MPTQFDQLLQYTVWANDTVFAVLDKYGAQVPATSLRLISHIVNAQSTWLVRLNGVPPVTGIWDERDLAASRRLNEQTLRGFRTVMESPEFDPRRKVEYRNSGGVPFENTVSDILTQVFNHGTYHRAQIAMDLRQHGLEPVNTDYITFIRSAHG